MSEDDRIHEYYRSETNRRLQSIESDLRILLRMRTQILTTTMFLSGIVSIIVTFIGFLFK